MLTSSTIQKPLRLFSSPCLGILFSHYNNGTAGKEIARFSSPCLGILFSHGYVDYDTAEDAILFSSPCLGILFSHDAGDVVKRKSTRRFSSPCLGILFSPSRDGATMFTAKVFSSPCLGILFSQQARESPRSGLSIALLRRGFPIDWNSHYFHPLTYCFLRFHAYRRGFLFL